MSVDQLNEEIMREVEINPDDLDREITRQPSKYCYWAMLLANASKKVARQKLAIKELEATLSRDYRLMMSEREPNVRVTESMVATFMANTDEYRDQARKVIYAQHEVDVLTGAREGFRQRAQMIMELGRQRREEMFETDMTIFKKEAKGRYDDRIGTAKGRARRPDGAVGGK